MYVKHKRTGDRRTNVYRYFLLHRSVELVHYSAAHTLRDAKCIDVYIVPRALLQLPHTCWTYNFQVLVFRAVEAAGHVDHVCSNMW